MAKGIVPVVDDGPMIRWVSGEALRGWNYDPVEADTAASALSERS